MEKYYVETEQAKCLRAEEEEGEVYTHALYFISKNKNIHFINVHYLNENGEIYICHKRQCISLCQICLPLRDTIFNRGSNSAYF